MAAVLQKTITTKGVKKSTISASTAEPGAKSKTGVATGGALVCSVIVETSDPNVTASGVVWLEVRDEATDTVVVNPAGPLSAAELANYKQYRKKIFAAGVADGGYTGDPDAP